MALIFTDLRYAFDHHASIVGAGFPLAIISTAIILASIAFPLGCRTRPTLTDRFLTVTVRMNVGTASSPA